MINYMNSEPTARILGFEGPFLNLDAPEGTYTVEQLADFGIRMRNFVLDHGGFQGYSEWARKKLEEAGHPVPAGDNMLPDLLFGHDLTDVARCDLYPDGLKTASIDLCKSVCVDDPTCSAYIYSDDDNYEGKNCWPVKKYNDIQETPGRIVGLVRNPPEQGGRYRRRRKTRKNKKTRRNKKKSRRN